MATLNQKHSTTSSLGKEFQHEEFFEVDRSKLQKMATTVTFIQAKTKADLYFEQIMETTQTKIEYQQSLDQAIKNKHHPFIRVCGSRIENINWAKGLILARLEVNDSIFRLKMAVSNIDHSHIMGRNNNMVNRIMNDTQTHIQFPDPNLIKKSNQVTVNGMLDDVEIARSLLRLSSPILMSFELPKNRALPSPESVGIYYKVHVTFLSNHKSNKILVLIRGTIRRTGKLKQAARSLLINALGKMAANNIVSLQVQVPPQHHESVKGENCENINQIMQKTNTKIFFPVLSMRGNRKSQVTITGNVDEVFNARAELVGNFPIEFTFDITDDYETATEIMELGRKAGVRITISQKERDIGMSITIKASEKMMGRIYEIHRIIRQLNSKNKAHTFDLFGAAYQRQIEALMENDDDVEKLIEERSETASEGDFNQQSPVISSSPVSAQDQQHIWTIYDPSQNTEQEVHQYATVPQVHYYSPAQCYQDWNNWIQPDILDNLSLNGRDVPIDTPDHNNWNVVSFDQDNQSQYTYSSQQSSDWTFPAYQGPLEENHQKLIQIDPVYLQQQQEQQMEQNSEPDVITFGSFDRQQIEELLGLQNSDDENEKPSPLIVGSEETVAGRLICSGWGSLF